MKLGTNTILIILGVAVLFFVMNRSTGETEETAGAFGPGRRRRKRDKWAKRLCATCARKGCSHPSCQGAVECGC